MKLSVAIEKLSINGGLQVLELVSKEVKSLDEANELGYDDFECRLYIHGRFIAEISPVLAKSAAWEAMIDEVDWSGLYLDARKQHLKVF